jgi:hypothetical protein
LASHNNNDLSDNYELRCPKDHNFYKEYKYSKDDNDVWKLEIQYRDGMDCVIEGVPLNYFNLTN